MNPDENWEWLLNGRQWRTSDLKIQTFKLILRLWGNFEILRDPKQMADIYLHLRASWAIDYVRITM